MRMVVLGATGTAGRLTAIEARSRGHDVVAVSRSGGTVEGCRSARVDVGADEALLDALVGADVVIDTLNTSARRRSGIRAFFVQSASAVSTAAAALAVPRVVVLSIVGIDDIPYGYYEAKVAQESTYAAADVPVTVVRTTQFHEFVGQIIAGTTFGPVALVPRMRIQPLAASDAATALVDAATGPPSLRAADVAGPQVHELPALARRLIASRGAATRVVAVPVPSRAGRMMAKGALLPKSGRCTDATFDDWLDRQAH
ncbi:MAG: SDR family oxidoreductase [Actinomycetes bacterium]